MSGQGRAVGMRRALTAGITTAAVATVLASCADGDSSAQGSTSECVTGDYPSQAISLVIPYAAGGGTDTVMRPFASALERALGESVVVVNKPGGGGIVGTAEGAAAKPDGYTVVAPIDSLLTVQPELRDDVPFDLESFTSIEVGTIPQTLVVGADQPYETMKDYLAAAEKAPGTIRYGVPGVATDNDLVGHGLELAADADLKSTPFAGGGAESLRAVLRGDIESSVIIYPTVKGSVEAGKLRVLAVLDDERLEVLPEVPSMSDLGLESEFTIPTGISLSVPAETPQEVVDVLDCGTKLAVEDPKLLKQWSTTGVNPAYHSPEDTRERLTGIRESMKDLVGEFPELESQ